MMNLLNAVREGQHQKQCNNIFTSTLSYVRELTAASDASKPGRKNICMKS